MIRQQTLRSTIRLVKRMACLMSFLLSIYTVTSMSLTVALYEATVNAIRTLFLPGEKITREPWHHDSKLSLTVLLLSTSTMFRLCGLVDMAMYLKRISTANKAIVRTGKMAYRLYAVHLFVWIATAVTYKKGRMGMVFGDGVVVSKRRSSNRFGDKVDFELIFRIQVRYTSRFYTSKGCRPQLCRKFKVCTCTDKKADSIVGRFVHSSCPSDSKHRGLLIVIPPTAESATDEPAPY